MSHRSSDPEGWLPLHEQLCANDPTTAYDLFRLAMPVLVAWLVRRFANVSPDFCEEAVGTALSDHIRNPHRFDPTRGSLGAYLRRAARCDLLNLLEREERHHRNRIGWPGVEHSPDGRNCLGRDDDPAWPLLLAESLEAAGEQTVARDEIERRVLELMDRGCRRTRDYAEAMAITQLPPQEQTRQVKRMKDRLTLRRKRAEVGRE